MSSEQDRARLIAERIARRLAQSNGTGAASSDKGTGRSGGAEVSGELATLRASLAELQERLAQVESQVKESGSEVSGPGIEAGSALSSSTSSTQAPQTRSPWLSGMYVPATHPSNERFGVAEAAVSELVDFFESEKTCSMEAGNKPCDHCAMCSSRGF